jgi:hypothetical protein
MLVGRRGNLSLALQREFKEEEIRVIGSDIANSWTSEDGLRQIKADLEELDFQPSLIINAAELVNPNADLSRLMDVNFTLPMNLELYSRTRGVKLLTFGSIMENIDEITKSNPYLISKRKYFEYLVNEVPSDTSSLHLQIHTWYGGESLHPHMFLGQMFSALKQRKTFEMSNGMQLREYHNIFDDTAAVKYLLLQDARGIIQVSHGESLPLKEIAISVFNAFDSFPLLKIGSLKFPEFEVMEKLFLSFEWPESITFRDTCSGIVKDFQRFL